MSAAPSHPLEIPRLIVTPSTPTDDVPIGEGRLRLTPPRNQPLLLTSDRPFRPLNTTTRPSPAMGTAVRPRSLPSSTSTRSSAPSSRHSDIKTYGCAPRIQSYPLERPSSAMSRCNSRTRLRRGVDDGPLPLHGRGTAASLVLITAAFLLVMASIVLSPDTILRLLGEQKKWAGDARKSLVALMEVDHAHVRVPSDRAMVIDSHTRREDEYQAGGRSAVKAVDEVEHRTAGPVMSHDAWKTYLRRRQQVMGGAGATAHIEAWDFH